MKATGVIRRIDELGRVVIPKEIRKVYRLAEGDPLEIYVDGEGIVIKRYDPCGNFMERLEQMIEEGKTNGDIPAKKQQIINEYLQRMKQELTEKQE